MSNRAYRFEPFLQYPEDKWQENEKAIKHEMNNLLNNFQFVVSGGYMYETNSIVSVGEGLRGPRFEFKNNEYEWWYNIQGAYKLVE